MRFVLNMLNILILHISVSLYGFLVQVHVDNLSDKQVANQVEVRGPPASKAFDQLGNPTKVFFSGIYYFLNFIVN